MVRDIIIEGLSCGIFFGWYLYWRGMMRKEERSRGIRGGIRI